MVLSLAWSSSATWGEDPGPAFSVVVRWTETPFQFGTGTRDRHDLPEIMGGGIAVFDADDDGWLDLYACNGGPIAAGEKAGDDPPCRLYRNLGDGRFSDVTDQAHAPDRATRWARRSAISKATAVTTCS